MSTVGIGKICIKKFGRESGKKCVIIDIVDKSFVYVTGPKALSGIKRRRVNVKHLETTNDSLKIMRGASDEDVIDAVKNENKNNLIQAEPRPRA